MDERKYRIGRVAAIIVREGRAGATAAAEDIDDLYTGDFLFKIRDLRSRLYRAVAELQTMTATGRCDWRELDRLLAKIDGVKLALSYVEEITRGEN